MLPALAPDLSYQALDQVHDGGEAQGAFLEAISAQTPVARREALRGHLLAYLRKSRSSGCRLDTYAMVRLWQVFAGRTDWSL